MTIIALMALGILIIGLATWHMTLFTAMAGWTLVLLLSLALRSSWRRQ